VAMYTVWLQSCEGRFCHGPPDGTDIGFQSVNQIAQGNATSMSLSISCRWSCEQLQLQHGSSLAQAWPQMIRKGSADTRFSTAVYIGLDGLKQGQDDNQTSHVQPKGMSLVLHGIWVGLAC
jgi:hypothetical protein